MAAAQFRDILRNNTLAFMIDTPRSAQPFEEIALNRYDRR